VRAAALILAGVLVASAHAVAEARGRHRRADPVWVEFYATGPVHPGAPIEIPRQNGAVRRERLPVRTDKEPSDG
jgi:cell division protein FtsN